MTLHYNTEDGKPAHTQEECPYRLFGNCAKCVPIDVKTELGMVQYRLDLSREETLREQKSVDFWRKIVDQEARELASALGWNPDQYMISFGWDQMFAAVRELATRSDDVEEERESDNDRGDLGAEGN